VFFNTIPLKLVFSRLNRLLFTGHRAQRSEHSRSGLAKAMVDAPVLRLIDGHLFTHSYMRNNKSSGQKNVRCFPTCAVSGHNTSHVREA
jgi:hypothetical protein